MTQEEQNEFDALNKLLAERDATIYTMRQQLEEARNEFMARAYKRLHTMQDAQAYDLEPLKGSFLRQFKDGLRMVQDLAQMAERCDRAIPDEIPF